MLLSQLAGTRQFGFPLRENGRRSAGQLVGRGDIADGTVEAPVVVRIHETDYKPACIFQRDGRFGSNTLCFQALVPAFDFAVTLGIKWACANMGHAAEFDKRFEIAGYELGPVVSDHARACLRDSLASPLENHLNIVLFHLFANFPVDHGTAVTIEYRTHVIEGPSDVEVGDIHMPMLVGTDGLDKALSLATGDLRPPAHQAGLAENLVGCGWTYRYHVLVQHHVGQASVANLGMLLIITHDGLFFPILKPMIAGHGMVGFVYLAVAPRPILKFAAREPDPEQEETKSQDSPPAPFLDEIDDLITNIGLDPLAFQSPPSFFFDLINSVTSSLITPSLSASFCLRSAIFRSVRSDRRLLVSKALAPFSKNVFCHR